MLKINIYTDGSCINNPGPGGCAAIVKFTNKKIIFSSGYYYTTNNRMELMAIILPLNFFLFYKKKLCYINIYTDSNYLYKGINNWIYFWKKNSWKNNNNKLIKNIDLWIKIYNLVFFFKKKIKWHLIKSHKGNYYNEKCDKIAFFAAKNPTLKDLPLPFILNNKVKVR